MMFAYFFVLLLPVLCQAKIAINITVAPHKDDASVIFTGDDSTVITKHHEGLFNVTNDNLNRGMRVELGKIPDAIFLKDPTRYGDLFKKFKWPEVKRNLHVEKAEIIDLINKKVVLKTHEFINNSTESVKIRRSLYENVESTVYSSWSEEGMPKEDIFYDIIVNFGDDDVFKYENKWRNHKLRTTIVSIGQFKKGLIDVKPGQTVVTKLNASKTVFTVAVIYKAHLIGNLIGDYDRLYGKYHFWSPTIVNIMKAAKMNNMMKTKEFIEVVCYTKPMIEVFDKNSGLELKSYGPKRLFGKLKHRKKPPTERFQQFINITKN